MITAALAGGVAVVSLVRAEGTPAQTSSARTIRVVAQRFSYTPSEIVLKKGLPVVLEFESLDFQHGFSIPDLGVRADLPPGRLTRVRLTPQASGTYDFLCDNFCGAGHEQMNGRIIVKD